MAPGGARSRAAARAVRRPGRPVCRKSIRTRGDRADPAPGPLTQSPKPALNSTSDS